MDEFKKNTVFVLLQYSDWLVCCGRFIKRIKYFHNGNTFFRGNQERFIAD